MNILKLPVFVFFLFLSLSCSRQQSETARWSLAIHGGAGTILKENMTPENEAAIRAKLNEALDRGRDILDQGGSSLDAVEKVINILEDSPLFNAGKGAVFTHEGKNEMDASIMSGNGLKAGAVTLLTNIKNPISLARLVMDKSPHVFMAGKGAQEFAVQQGMQLVDTSYFYTPARWKSLQEALRQEKEEKYGTVGCVALDKDGNLAAGTSTGGMTNKRFGRIGDSPVIGAGTYANNATCAISATGHGEFFIRYTVAHDISALMEYKHYTSKNAAGEVINKKLVKAGGEGGVIVVDHLGNVVFAFNTPGMYRGFVKADGSRDVMFYGPEE